MNKGVTVATGDIIYFLNCGDYFYSDTIIENIVGEFKKNDSYNILFGDIIRYSDKFSKLQSWDGKRIVDIVAKGLCHQTIFAKHNLFKELGKFNTNYPIYKDFKWLLRVLILGKKNFHYVDMPIVYYLTGGRSYVLYKAHWHEREDIVRKYVFFHYCWCMPYLIQSVF